VIGNGTKFVTLDEELARAIANLPLLERCVLTLVYFYAQSQRQVADHLAVPLPSVARAAARALRLVAADLELVQHTPGARIRVDLVAQLLPTQRAASRPLVAIGPAV
jgi:hypothetical protein